MAKVGLIPLCPMSYCRKYLSTLSAAGLLSAATILPATGTAQVFTDSFADGDVQTVAPRGRFWTVVAPLTNPDSSAREQDGRLQLRASSWANTYASIVSPASADFGFFTQPVTVTLDDITLKAAGIPVNDARFKLSFTSTADRAEKAPDAISLRLRNGLLLFGYRIDGYNADTSPENLSGQHANAVLAEPLTGLPSKISLTLGPSPSPGFVHYEIRAEGNGVSFSRSGSFPLTLAQWGGADTAALVIDARRDNGTAAPDTYAELSLGQITVTR